MGTNYAGHADSYPPKFNRFIGVSKAMQEVYTKIQKLAPTDMPIFIDGESGTGKEICAQTIHYYSDRNKHSCIALNCAALPENLIESALFGHVKGAFTGANNTRDGAIAKAEQGTLFLDEICDLPITLQAKLLRFCQDFSYSKLGSDKILNANIRIVCATNKDVKQQIANGLFREDLYYRLYVTHITMPPLRHRDDDILDIAHHYLKYYAEEQNKPIKSFSENTEKILLQYDWPGNIRELQNIIRQIVALENTPLILASMLPDRLMSNCLPILPTTTTDKKINLPLWKIERNAIQNAISITRGNIPKAAAILDIAPSTIYRKIQLWNKK